MMGIKEIETIVAPGSASVAENGFRIYSYIPRPTVISMRRMDPFIRLDYNAMMYMPPASRSCNVEAHPHRGIETVTLAYKGKIAHYDNCGRGGIIEEGGVQWMTAGSGVLHKEYPEAYFASLGGEFQMVQLWVNLPAKNKLTRPQYQGVASQQIKKVTLPRNQGTIEVISGSYARRMGTIHTFTRVTVLHARLTEGGQAVFSFPSHHNTALLVLEGSIRVNDVSYVPRDCFAIFENHGERFGIQAQEKAVVLILSGEPIGEPIAVHGPFVMNTASEISQALQDFNIGRFGYLE